MPDASMTERLRKITDREVPGIAVAIAGPEGLRETAAAGYADLADGEPASADMACPWFSMTKIVTATLAMRLAGRGLLNLDQPVLPLVPELAVMQPRSLAERITPRHLLTHSAGFTNPIFLQMHLRDGELDGTRILPAPSAAEMRHVTLTGKRYDLGLGWFRPASQRYADPPVRGTSRRRRRILQPDPHLPRPSRGHRHHGQRHQLPHRRHRQARPDPNLTRASGCPRQPARTSACSLLRVCSHRSRPPAGARAL